MVFHQSFERTSRAVELYAKGWTNMVRLRKDRSSWRMTHKKMGQKKERQATT